VFAIISSLFSGIYVVPRKLSKLPAITYAMVMGLGNFAIAIIGYALFTAIGFINEPLFFNKVALACVNGVIWMIASVSVLSSIDRIGLAKSNQWKSLQGPIGAALMLTFYSEYLTAKVVFILLAMGCITLAAIMFSTPEKNNAPVDKKGIAYAVIAAIFYGISALIKKTVTNEGILFAQQIYSSFFVFFSAAVIVAFKAVFKHKPSGLNTPKIAKEIILPVIGGVLFYGNSSFNVLAYSRIEGSITAMLHQLNAIWLFLLGVFVFNEIEFGKYWARLATGLALSAVGVVMLILAKV